MSRNKRNFSSEFKAKVVLEVLKGEQDISQIAVSNEIHPNLLRNWKREFLEKAHTVFKESSASDIKDILKLERKEKEAYARKVGQLTMQVDWLKKKSAEILGPDWKSKYSPKPFEE